EGIWKVTLAEMFSLLLLVVRPVKAKNVIDARIPAIYGWGVSNSYRILEGSVFDLVMNRVYRHNSSGFMVLQQISS
ncbi:hypothetical protein, partial [Nostoc favosum]